MTAFIWDLDGTLFDSYPIIVAAVCQAAQEQGITMDKETVLREVTASSVTDVVHRIAAQHHRDEAACLPAAVSCKPAGMTRCG